MKKDDLPDEPGDRLAYSGSDRYKSQDELDDMLDRVDAERESPRT
jgi:hypothetical protein